MLRGVVKAQKKRDTHIQLLKVDVPKPSNFPVHSREHTVPACTHYLLFKTYKITET
jgi:hypothetical protein